MKKIITAVLLTQLLISCSESKQKDESPVAVEKKDSMVATPDAAFKDVVFDSKKDLTCGMPVTAGVADTAHYKGKVYGFCAKECKDEFVKNPEQYLTAK